MFVSCIINIEDYERKFNMSTFFKNNKIGLLILGTALGIGILLACLLNDSLQTKLATVFLFPSIVVGIIVWSSIGISQKSFQDAVAFDNAQKDLEMTEKKELIKELQEKRNDLIGPLKLVNSQSKLFIEASRSHKKVDRALVDNFVINVNIIITNFEYINNNIVFEYKNRVTSDDDKIASKIGTENSYSKILQEIVSAIDYFKSTLRSEIEIVNYIEKLDTEDERKLTASLSAISKINTIYFPKIISHWLGINDDSIFKETESEDLHDEDNDDEEELF